MENRIRGREIDYCSSMGKDGGNQSSGYENKESKLNIRTWNKQDLIILSLLGLSL
jgi:hypothetical protein